MSPQKPVKKLFKIGEVAEYGGLTRQTVNYYTALGILREARRTPSGHRLYDEAVFDRIERVRELKAKHTLREIAEMMRSEGVEREPEKGADGPVQ
jgi:DNA-binding transcriptional MerR regulator